MSPAAHAVPASTYRLQLHRGFDFAAAKQVVPYLARLGITHVYLSPITTAVPGSKHGYDVVDPTRLNPELGGERDYRALADTLRGHGLSQLLDIVPNHMGAAAENRWWSDVLRRGPASPYARVYDIDWSALGEESPRVVLPVLGDTLDRVLEDGELTLAVTDGEPELRYFDHSFPLARNSLAEHALADEDVETTVERLNAAVHTPGGSAAMRRLLDAQHFRLGHWRSAKPRVNYRRFFVIDELVGVRVEDPAVFALTHSLPLGLVSAGTVNALRVDHVDGLADPAAYLRQLRVAATVGRDDHERSKPYVVVEKILAEDEALPPHWDCAGTTGYDFMRDVNAVLVDAAGADAITAVYERFTGRDSSYEQIAHDARRAIVQDGLSGQLRSVSTLLYDSAAARRNDLDPAAIHAALEALLPCFERYRSYHTIAAHDPDAPRLVQSAYAHASARAAQDSVEQRALDFVADMLAAPPTEAMPAVERLQQLMPTVQAKGVEDTACYRYARLLSLSEVGSSPGAFGIDVPTFHARNRARHEQRPASMLATATHDHKRGEDVRTRLNVLSELPGVWHASLQRWWELNAMVRPSSLDQHDDYVLHQVLLGAWPPSHEHPDSEFVERVQDYLVKYAREAAERTSWTAPNAPYERALREYTAALLNPEVSAAFLSDRAAFQARLSALGAINSLSQTLLKLSGPGVADTYQGAELWDLSLVDPDNRQPVDYAARAALLDRLDATAPGELLAAWPSAAVKLHIMASALRLRRDLHPFFVDADYVPLAVSGTRARHVVAFARTGATGAVVAIATRLPAVHCSDEGAWAPTWGDTTVMLPGAGPAHRFREVFTNASIERTQSELPLGHVLETLPVALLVAE